MMLRTIYRSLGQRCPTLFGVLHRFRHRRMVAEMISSGRYDPDPKEETAAADYARPDEMSSIPRCFHVTWKTADLPTRYQANVDRMRELHPSWDIEIWSDDRITAFVKQYFADLAVSFHSLPKNIMRVDVFRYMLMHQFGGVYTDLDVWFLQPIDDVLSDCRIMVPGESDLLSDSNFLAQHLLASIAGEAFWLDCVHEVLAQSAETIAAYTDPIEVTGPAMVTRVWRRDPARYRIKVPRRVVFCAPSWLRRDGAEIPEKCVALHECTGTWR